MPEVSVVLPVRDGQDFLDAAIASMRAQSFKDFELLVIDDGSQDRSAAIAARHAAEDGRVIPLASPGSGLVAALNFGLARARAPLVARMDADDLALPDRLARQTARMDAEPDILVLGTGFIAIDGEGRRLGTVIPCAEPDEVARALQRVNVMAHPTVLMRRAAVEAVGAYRRAYLLAEDYDLWLRLAERGKLANLAEPLIAYRTRHVPFSAARFGRQVLSEVAACAAARLRRAGKPDPTGEWDDIDPDALHALRVDSAMLANEITRRALHAARNGRRSGDRQAWREALRLAAMQPRNGLREQVRFLLRRAGARF